MQRKSSTIYQKALATTCTEYVTGTFGLCQGCGRLEGLHSSQRVAAAVADKAAEKAAKKKEDARKAEAYFAAHEVPQDQYLFDGDFEAARAFGEPILFLTSKFSAEVYDVDTLVAELRRGGVMQIGSGTTPDRLKGLGDGQSVKVITNDAVCLHDKALRGWKDHFRHYSDQAQYGCLILLGTVEMYQKWAKSGPCLQEVAQLESGRVFAYIEGYIVALTVGGDGGVGTGAATVRNGEGLVVYGDGDYYKGHLKGGQPDGQGTFSYASGNCYVGQWKDGKMDGQGTYTWASGNCYVGQYKDGKKDGQGTFTWADGDCYVGQWKANKQEGKGKMTNKKGKVLQVGQYKAGKFVG